MHTEQPTMSREKLVALLQQKQQQVAGDDPASTCKRNTYAYWILMLRRQNIAIWAFITLAQIRNNQADEIIRFWNVWSAKEPMAVTEAEMAVNNEVLQLLPLAVDPPFLQSLQS